MILGPILLKSIPSRAVTQSTDTSLSDYSSISSDETDESILAQLNNSSSRGAKRARIAQGVQKELQEEEAVREEEGV